MKIRPIFAWFDFWIGLFWDRKKRWLYILPVPCFGVVVQFPIIGRPPSSNSGHSIHKSEKP